MPAWRLSAVSVLTPSLLVAANETVANSGGIQSASIMAEGRGIDLESWVQLVGMLLLVLGLFAAFAWSVKRWRLLPQMRGTQNRLQILETKPLGQRNSIMVVGYGEQRFLIGTNSAGLQMLGQLPDEKSNLSQTDQVEDQESEGGILSAMNNHIGKEGE